MSKPEKQGSRITYSKRNERESIENYSNIEDIVTTHAAIEIAIASKNHPRFQ